MANEYIDPDPSTGRRVVTIAQWDKRPDALIDTCAYWFSKEAYECSMDPWSVVDGVDKHVDGAGFDVWFASGQMKAAAGTQQLYVDARHYILLPMVNKDVTPHC